MPFDKTVEAIIQEAMQRGEFDHLSGKGKPVDLSAYFETPEDVRMAHSMLKNAGMVSQEIELLQEISGLKEKLSSARGKEAKRKLRETIASKQLRLDVMMERQRRQRRKG